MAALAKDVNIVKTLPKSLKSARRNKEIPVFKAPYAASPYYYLHNVLPILIKHSVVELVVADGGCLQVIADANFLWTFDLNFKHFLFNLEYHLFKIYVKYLC